MKAKSLQINQSICDLIDVITSIQDSSQTQDEKADSLDTFNQNMEKFIEDK